MEFNFPNFSLGAGNILALGQAKTGKSTLLKWIAINFMLKSGSVIYFDIAKGAYVTTQCVEGSHVSLDNTSNKSICAPIQTLTEKNVCDFLFTLLMLENLSLTSDRKSAVVSAVKMVKELAKTHQTISGILPYIMDIEVRSALKQYTIVDGYDPMFDASEESIDFKAKWLCLESKHAFESGKKATACISYCFSRIEEIADGRPILIIFDDAGIAFQSENIVSKLVSWINNLRKKNISFVFACHQLTDISSNLKDTLLNHCDIRVYTPNKQVLSNSTVRESYQSIGLLDNQLEILAKSAPRKEYMIQTATGKCQIFDLMIEPKSIEQIITGGSNTLDIQLMERLNAQYGDKKAVDLYIKKKSKGGKYV